MTVRHANLASKAFFSFNILLLVLRGAECAKLFSMTFWVGAFFAAGIAFAFLTFTAIVILSALYDNLAGVRVSHILSELCLLPLSMTYSLSMGEVLEANAVVAPYILGGGAALSVQGAISCAAYLAAKNLRPKTTT